MQTKPNYIISLVLFSAISLSTSVLARGDISPSRLNKLSGESSLPFDNKTVWDQRYNKRSYIYGKSPAKFLAENFDFIPSGSSILDMGMGEGRNAVFLAQKGHKVTGIDISSVAIKKARKLARERGVKIKTILGSLDKYKFGDEEFDVIICFYFVARNLNSKIRKWLKPGGLLIYEADTLKEFERTNVGERDYYLKPQELLKMFPGFKVIKYEEPLHESKYRASIILQKG